MAEIRTEANQLNQAIQALATQLVDRIRRDIVISRNEGTPDNTIKLRVKERINGPGADPISGIIRAVKAESIAAVRRTYQTTSTLAQTAIETNTPINYILPEERGYKFNLDENGRRVYTLGENPRTQRARNARAQAQAAGQDIPLMWVAAFRNTCPDCISLNGQVKTKEEWDQGGILPGNGRTRCGEHCQCHLAPVSRLANRFEIEGTEQEKIRQLQSRIGNGIKLQKKKIEELENIRGRKFSESYKTQLMGQIKTPFFNPNFQDREALFKTNSRGADAFAKKVIIDNPPF